MSMMATNSRTKSRADALRQYLLPITLAHAVGHSKYYRDTFGPVVDEVATLNDLSRLPFIERSHLASHRDDLLTFSTFPDHVIYTSGTTDVPLEVPVYQQEIDAYDNFILSRWQEKLDAEPPLNLTVLRVGQGVHILRGNVPALPCHVDHGLEQFLRLMGEVHLLKGRPVQVQAIDASVQSLRQITEGLLTLGIDPKDFGVKVLTVAGWYLPAVERELFEDSWGATLHQRYGVSEVRGGANWCPQCRYYHFDFTVIPEVIDTTTGTPIEEGFGSMVLTGLYPFNQAIPKIRYLVRDLVEVRKTTCRSSERGFRFVSRLRDAIPAPEGSAVPYRLFASDVVEALARLPDVPRTKDTSFLKFELSTTSDSEALIRVELRYPPKLFPSRTREIHEQILKVLTQRCPAIGRPYIEFVRPGQLRKITKL